MNGESKMTFDDKNEELISKFTWVPIAEMGKAFSELKKEYAPTIEMTKKQKEVFLFYKNTTWFSLFLCKLNDPDNKEFRSLPNLNAFKDWGFQKEHECELMQAWLHPETIKIVDE